MRKKLTSAFLFYQLWGAFVCCKGKRYNCENTESDEKPLFNRYEVASLVFKVRILRLYFKIENLRLDLENDLHFHLSDSMLLTVHSLFSSVITDS